MPYYCSAGLPEWDEYLDKAESENIAIPPTSSFQYVEPSLAKTSIVSFPAVPGIEPMIPGEPDYPARARRPQGFSARLFGRRQPAASVPALTPEQQANWLSKFQEREKAASEHALWKVSTVVARFRAAGVKRVIGSYDGGGDESFTHFHSVEMNDDRKIGNNDIGRSEPDYAALIDDAAAAIMGTFGAGEFFLRGALTIDFDTCTITDEKDAAIVFGFGAGDVG